jgi:hypothetical protein
MLRADPSMSKLKTETSAATFTALKIETPDESLAKLLKLTLDPNVLKFKAEKEAPILAVLRKEKVEPKLA